MGFRILFAPGFFEDLQQAVDWYNDKQAGLGARFFKASKVRISGIKNNPYSVAVRYDNVRCAKLKKFPYMIHFRIQENNVIEVIAIFNTHRNPNIWASRI